MLASTYAEAVRRTQKLSNYVYAGNPKNLTDVSRLVIAELGMIAHDAYDAEAEYAHELKIALVSGKVTAITEEETRNNERKLIRLANTLQENCNYTQPTVFFSSGMIFSAELRKLVEPSKPQYM